LPAENVSAARAVGRAPINVRSGMPSGGSPSQWIAILKLRIVTGRIDREAAMIGHTQHEKARREAFGWYVGDPPSPDEARRHFMSRARLHPEDYELYDEALRIYLATCKIKRDLF
jgi:hypothetical protein